MATDTALKVSPADAETLGMSDLVVIRWARYGHERLYVRTQAGVCLGYWDCRAGLGVVKPGTDREAFDAALARHLAKPALPAARTGPVDAPDRLVAAAVVAREAVPAVGEPAHMDVYPVLVDLPPSDACPSPPIVPTDLPTPEGPSWTDLVGTRPGGAARKQAIALRKAAPVRTFVARALRVRTDERAWRVGADGEEAVAARLARLGDRWKVLHAVPVGEKGSDIDHVVIGPGGVFPVNAKHHPDATVWVGGDTLMVNGKRVPYVRNSRHEALRAARLLTAAGAPSVTVTGLIAVMGVRGGFTVKAQPADGQVVVLRRKDLDRWLAARPHVLDEEQVERVHAAARRGNTWR